MQQPYRTLKPQYRHIYSQLTKIKFINCNHNFASPECKKLIIKSTRISYQYFTVTQISKVFINQILKQWLQKMAISLVQYYPLNIGKADQTIDFWRMILGVSMATQLLTLVLLRLLTIILCSQVQRQVEENQKKTQELLRQRPEREHNKEEQKDQNQIAGQNQSNLVFEQICSDNKEQIKKAQLKNVVDKQKNIFEFQEIKDEFDSSVLSEECTSSVKYSSRQVPNEVQKGQVINSVKELPSKEKFTLFFINLRFFQVHESQYSEQINILVGHFFIASCAAYMYFPFWCSASLAILHFTAVLLLIFISIFFQKQSRTRLIITRVGVVVIFFTNLALLAFAIFGIARSNSQYFNFEN